jgi:hypothetical protein
VVFDTTDGRRDSHFFAEWIHCVGNWAGKNELLSQLLVSVEALLTLFLLASRTIRIRMLLLTLWKFMLPIEKL